MSPLICQSCGMPMAAAEHFGTLADNSPSRDYCCFCYNKGNFTDDFTLEEKIAESVGYHDPCDRSEGRTVTRNEMELRMRQLLPQLKRWKSHRMTHETYYKAVNTAVVYINDFLHTPLTLHELAGRAALSEYHFHRIFKSVIGESPGEYIQRLRLEKAAFFLQTSDKSLDQMAESVGYATAAALSKAFKKRFGMSPAVFKKTPAQLNVPIRSLPDSIEEPQIRELPCKKVVFTPVRKAYEDPLAFLTAWTLLLERMDKWNLSPAGREYFGLTRDSSAITEPEKNRIYVCVTAPEHFRPSGKFGVQIIEGGTYAVFTSRGSHRQLEDLYCYIYRSWIPRSSYRLRDVSYFEKYLGSPSAAAQDRVTEICIPVEPLANS